MRHWWKHPSHLDLPPFNHKVKEIVKRNFLILRNHPEITDPPLTSFRHNKNILKNWCSAQSFTGSAGTFSCGRSRRNTCAFLNPTTRISGPQSDHTIRHQFLCVSSNIIYCITCDKYPKIYSNETADAFLTGLLSIFVRTETMMLTNL